MRATTFLVGGAAINAVLPLAFANLHPPQPTDIRRQVHQSSFSVSTSYSTVATLLATNGDRVYTVISVPVPITFGIGGNSTTSDVRNSTSTLSGGQNTTAIQSTQTSTTSTPTSLPYAPSTIPYGGGGTTVAAPVPGGSGNLPQGPGDGYHNAADHVKGFGTIIGLCIGVGSVAAVQLGWLL